MAADIPKEQLRITSYEHMPNDFRVAKSICERHGLRLNVGSPQKYRCLSASDAIRIYLLSCGGTYLPMYPISTHFVQGNAEIRITGDQPTAWNYFDGGGIFNGNAEKISRDIEFDLKGRGVGEAVSREFMNVFQDINVDPNHPGAMLAYYSAVRSRHHCGRNWYKSLGSEFLVSPLAQRSFVALDFENIARGLSPQKIFADAFSAFGGWALEEPFETPERALSSELLEHSIFKGGVDINPRQYRVFGRLENYDESELGAFSIGLSFNPRPDKIKDELAELFYGAGLVKSSNLFLKEDFAFAKSEIRSRGSLSHGYRKLSHILSTEQILKIVDQSG